MPHVTAPLGKNPSPSGALGGLPTQITLGPETWRYVAYATGALFIVFGVLPALRGRR